MIGLLAAYTYGGGSDGANWAIVAVVAVLLIGAAGWLFFRMRGRGSRRTHHPDSQPPTAG
ncbi:MAG: hypothetical protein ABWZ53_03775 [Actinomycetota bacterium]